MELKKFQFGVFVLRTIELNFRQCHILVLIVFSMLTWGVQAQAANPSLTFKNGWIGEYSTGGGGNPHQPDNVYAFRGSSQATIAIESVTISQESATGLFVKSPQGNDVPVTLTIRFVDSTKAPVTTSAALVNWRSSGGSPRDLFGVIFSTELSDAVDGYTRTSTSTYKKTYLLRNPSSTATIGDGADN